MTIIDWIKPRMNADEHGCFLQRRLPSFICVHLRSSAVKLIAEEQRHD
ncbi:hypothetical protein [Wenzhouxiangella limi]|uniref:Uncharacterized protein n=1 Tax=Wenzhouxiangella limi TaxID=2707351 RepID=A0A845UVR3_9GAMM|nr:hypothetical protein [Wenzhouxiangella limi]NDY94624.1 hypothetical protein [Wenzhouxiangella limi]